MIPARVEDWLDQNGFGQVASTQPVSGGCINEGLHLTTDSGDTFFLKSNTRTPPDMFEAEAEGLRALSVPGGPRIPQVFLAGPFFLLLENLSPAERCRDYWPKFGRQLAILHQQHGQKFGFPHNNYIGSTPQPNPWTENGHEFFGQIRLGFQADLAQGRGLLSVADKKRVDILATRLERLVPDQPPSLIHGDLWHGNAITDREGQPALIDPAAHYGWAEAELGMTAAFGAFPDPFYQAYNEVSQLTTGYRERFPIYNLYHLLNHLNLFGGGYLGRVRAILDRFT